MHASKNGRVKEAHKLLKLLQANYARQRKEKRQKYWHESAKTV